MLFDCALPIEKFVLSSQNKPASVLQPSGPEMASSRFTRQAFVSAAYSVTSTGGFTGADALRVQAGIPSTNEIVRTRVAPATALPGLLR